MTCWEDSLPFLIDGKLFTIF